jgi:hypothetical protein
MGHHQIAQEFKLYEDWDLQVGIPNFHMCTYSYNLGQPDDGLSGQIMLN